MPPAITLFDAVRSGDLALLERMIAEGADVHWRDGEGFTPMHRAILARREDMVRALVAAGAVACDPAQLAALVAIRSRITEWLLMPPYGARSDQLVKRMFGRKGTMDSRLREMFDKEQELARAVGVTPLAGLMLKTLIDMESPPMSLPEMPKGSSAGSSAASDRRSECRPSEGRGMPNPKNDEDITEPVIRTSGGGADRGLPTGAKEGEGVPKPAPATEEDGPAKTSEPVSFDTAFGPEARDDAVGAPAGSDPVPTEPPREKPRPTNMAKPAEPPAPSLQTSGIRKESKSHPAGRRPPDASPAAGADVPLNHGMCPNMDEFSGRFVPARATPRGTWGLWERLRRDKADCTLFAPPEVPSGQQFLVQVFAHKPGQARKAAAAAKEFDGDAERRGVTCLGTRIRRGSRLMFELVMPPLRVAQALGELVWHGRAAGVQFAVTVPKDLAPGTVVGTVYVSQDWMPIGQVSFKLKVVGRGASAAAAENVASGEARRYTCAFVSYASEDLPEVLLRVPMLTTVGVKYIQDVFNLEPGDEWLPRIYQWIDSSDVFLLFWSSHAKRSKWVRKEWQHALARGGKGFIRPVIIEGPPIPEPPPELAHLHFSDRTRFF